MSYELNADSFPFSYTVPVLVSSELLNTLATGGIRAIDSFLLKQLQYLKQEYNRNGNPHLVLLAATAIANPIRQLPYACKSFQFNSLTLLSSELLIAHGQSRASLLEAKQLAEEVLGNAGAFSLNHDTVLLLVKGSLLRAVAMKAIGQFDDSLRFLTESVHELGKWNSTEYESLPLVRQQVIMHQSAREHQKLFETALQLRDAQPSEYFGSLKRVFEFLLNKEGVKEAEKLYPEYIRAFRAAGTLLPPLSHISFAKNVGQLFLLQDRATDAIPILQRALQEAQMCCLQGQVRQIKSLIVQAEAEGAKPKLTTFFVPES